MNSLRALEMEASGNQPACLDPRIFDEVSFNEKQLDCLMCFQNRTYISDLDSEAHVEDRTMRIEHNSYSKSSSVVIAIFCWDYFN